MLKCVPHMQRDNFSRSTDKILDLRFCCNCRKPFSYLIFFLLHFFFCILLSTIMRISFQSFFTTFAVYICRNCSVLDENAKHQ